MSNDYAPPGLGRNMENLISKHSKRMTVGETTYQWAVRNAAKTRALLYGPAEEAPKPATATPDPSTPTLANGRTAYEWAVANGKTCKEAALACRVRVSCIQSYRKHHELPPLKDGRINTGDYRRKRRKNAEVADLCRLAVINMKATKRPLRDVAMASGITPQSLLRHCINQGIKWIA